QVALSRGAEPGRLVEDGAGRVHVALRGARAIVTIDPASAKIVDWQEVCTAPRGLAWDSAADVVHVACAGGELVTVPAAGGAPVRQLLLERDLRDVVVDGANLWVSKFRTAEVLRVSAQGEIWQRRMPPTMQTPEL